MHLMTSEDTKPLVNGNRNGHSHGHGGTTEQRTGFSPRQMVVFFLLAMLTGASIPSMIQYFNKDTTDNSTSDIERKNNIIVKTKLNVSPEVALLMSFPNSGTSFTLRLVFRASGLNYASNYGDRHTDTDGLSMPLYPKHAKTKKTLMDGPYWAHPSVDNPTKYALTKTHCAGTCNPCRPGTYVQNPHNFLTYCLSSKGIEDVDGEKKSVSHVYSPDVVSKAVHLIRNPFDNLVSRYHLEVNEMVKRNETENVERYERSPRGFRRFCDDVGKKYEEYQTNKEKVDQHVLQLLHDFPCHLDFFRYIQWHNLAFITTKDFLAVPTHLLYFEDYEEDFDKTTQDLLDFLELPNTGNQPPFKKGKTYDDYFTDRQRSAGKEAARALASQETWRHIEHYFEDIE